MNQYKHLTLEERKSIERALTQGESFKFIARALGRSPSTISREVLKNSRVRQSGSFNRSFNNCLHRASCQEYGLCNKEDCRRAFCRGCPLCFRLCSRYVREECSLLRSPPYVCNGCEKRSRCSLEKFIYQAKNAHQDYRNTLSDSRSGISVTPLELQRLEGIISPLILKGQSPYVICKTNKDAIMLDDKTIYKYINAGLFSAKNIDLLRKVKMRPRRKKATLKVERSCRKKRTYRDFLDFMEQYPDTAVVQMDTVEGKKGDEEKVLLTIHFTQSQFMLAFIRNANTARSVAEVFHYLWELLGPDLFRSLFPLCLTDNGSEFTQPSAIELDPQGKRRTRVFYCDPYASYQKGAIENNHSLLRRVIPKGISFNGLTQDDISLLMNHINSYPRKKLNDRSPLQSFSFFHPLIPEKLGVREIPTNDINLTPSLLRR
jgi:IS30 family transposase